MPTEATREANRSYREVLRNRQVAGLLLGDLLANVGTGMIIVAMPVQTLSIHGSVPKAIAIGLVEAAPFILSTILALAIGLGRVRVPPRTLLIAECVLRSPTFGTLGVLAVTEQLTLPVLIVGRLFGAMFRMAGSSSRRLLATSITSETGRFAVNGLLGLNATFALYIVGPVLGGVIVASTSAGVALFFDACGALIFAFVGNLTLALIIFGLGGLVWAPFTPIAYSFPAIGARARRATAGRHALDDRLHGGRPTWPDHWRTTNRAGREHRRAGVVGWANTAAAPDCGIGCSPARIRVGHTFHAQYVDAIPLLNEGK
jgi:MFS family permease